MEIKGVDHVGLVVDDLAAAVTLLRDVFGFELEREFSVPGRVDGAMLRSGPLSVELMDVAPARAAADVTAAQVPRDHLAVEVDDLDAAIAELRARGVETTRPGASVSGATRSYFTRPETTGGMAFQVFERKQDSIHEG